MRLTRPKERPPIFRANIHKQAMSGDISMSQTIPIPRNEPNGNNSRRASMKIYRRIIASIYEGGTLSQSEVGISETDKLNEIVQLLASLWEAAQRLPEGSERQGVLRQIGGFQKRVAALIRRLGSEAQATS
jgi:hypothetical protein